MDGHTFTTGECLCEDPKNFTPLIQPVIEGLFKLDNTIRAVLLEAFKTIAELGISAVPGGPAITAARKAIEGAKTFAEKGLDAASYFNSWVGKSCGVPDWDFDLVSVFGKLINAPDSMGTSKGCFQRNKKICKEKPKNNPKDQPKDDSRDKADENSDKKPDDKNECKGKRAGGNNNGCNNDVHFTEITKSIPVLKTITKTCTGALHTQACYHYYSVLKNYNWIPKEHPCSDYHRQNRKEKTLPAIGKWEEQHKHNEWRKYAKESYTFKQQTVLKPACQRYEWPAAYFLPKSVTQDIENKKGQLVKWVPGQRMEVLGNYGTFFVATRTVGLVDLRRPGKVIKKVDGEKKTFITQYEAKFTRAVFRMAFDWTGVKIPTENNDWGLRDDPCWPEGIVLENPGYVLLNEDKWYKTAKGLSTVNPQTLGYDERPAAHSVQAAEQRRNSRLQKATVPPVNPRLKANPANQRFRKARNADWHTPGSEDRLQVLENDFAVRDLNNTPRLTEDEVKRDVQIIDCEDSMCTNEGRRLAEEGEGDDVVFIPGAPQPNAPSRNPNIIPTPVTTMVTKAKPEKRGETIPDIPAATGVAQENAVLLS
ncbi:hypothetical protein AJ79_04203 [Helicocarpus griseus UAMH5409]|uniref:Uncharacterized protein n=1 Tax=Helicocarpus griseus UAMH5409 TaxID=1447875 RepID=A0A2B7XVC4_9EURO|nr:hypothetical protein AJ79_04203 [Helicocarpus griseus UAMH5409]